MTEFDFAADSVLGFGDVFGVLYVDRSFEKVGDSFKGGFSLGRHFYKLCNRHKRPDEGVEIAYEFHKLTGVEYSRVHEIAAVAQNYAGYGLYEESIEDVEQGGELGISHVCVFVLRVESVEGEKLLVFLDESLDYRYARKTLLREVREVGEGFLTGIPLYSEILADDEGHREHTSHRNERKSHKHGIHSRHIVDCERT